MNAPLSAADIPVGFTFAAAHCGLKRSRLDLGILISEEPAVAAAVFTGNLVAAAPVIASREHIKKSRERMRGLIVNSGNANCCTRADGYPASIATATHLARQLWSDPSQILVCSTGVIGPPLRVEKIIAAIPQLVQSRSARGRRLRGIRPRHHDHGHAPEVGRRILLSRRQKSAPSRLRERFRDDSAEYGDDARLHRH